jgi:hypothetical protein
MMTVLYVIIKGHIEMEKINYSRENIEGTNSVLFRAPAIARVACWHSIKSIFLTFFFVKRKLKVKRKTFNLALS